MHFRLLCILLLLSSFACNTDLREDPKVNWLPQLHIDIQSEYMVLLKRKRHQALQEGLLINSSNDYVPATLQYQGQAMPAELRLKGDWLDHLKGKKWSFRIKLGEQHSFLGMRRFSIQHPRTRSFLDEWTFHQLLEQEQVLTPRYTFVQIILNGQYKGIYALEEHFDKLMVERQGRREAPILKFAEEGFWQIQEHNQRRNSKLVPYLPDFEAAEIAAFQKGRTLRDSTLKANFLAARQLMQQYQLAGREASALLDLDQMARFYALCDITEAWHALRWHNLRMYFNPITSRLEPIAFDAYGSDGPYRWFSKPFLGFHNETYDKLYFAEEYLVFYLFNEPRFRQLYAAYLKQYTAEGYIEQFMQRITPQLDSLQQALQIEYPNYRYKKQFLADGAARMRKQVATYTGQHPPFKYQIYDPIYEKCLLKTPLSKIAVNAWPSQSGAKVHVANYFCQPVSIQATGPKKSKPIHVLPRPIELPPFDIHNLPDGEIQVPISQGDRYLFYTVPGYEHWYRQKISTWPSFPNLALPDEQILQIDSSVFQQKNGHWYLPAGRHQIDQTILIPRSDSLIIAAGATIDFIRGAGLLVFGNIQLRGEAKKPIRLYSSDRSSRGCHLINLTDSLLIEHVAFEGLANWLGPDRWSSGSLSLYQTTATIQHCSFKNIHVEDALNIVRSKVVLSDLQFDSCRSDAIDLDFAEAQISNCRFQQIGGDAIDCSGTVVEIKEVVISEVGDKGVSLGEKSTAALSNCEMNKVRIGMAIKDASQATIQALHLSQCPYGLALFNKKPEFGPSTAVAKQLHFESVVDSFLIEKDHQLLFKGQVQQHTHAPQQISNFIYPEE